MAALGATVPAVVAAHEPDSYGFGSRSTAMGGAVVADADDFSASYYNPAALTGVSGLELTVGYVHADNRLRIQGRDTGVDDVHGLVAGVVAPGELMGVPFAFGIATYLPDDGLSRIKALRQEVPRWELYDTRASILFLAANLAVKPVKWLELGGGLAFLAATRGRFAISGRADVLNPYDSQLRHEVDADLTSVRYPQAGVRVTLGDLGKLGLVYRGQSQLQLSLDARLQGTVDYASIEIPLLYLLETRTVAGFLPQQVVLGASFTKVRRLSINADVGFVNWAAYDSPTARTTASLDAQPPPGTPVRLPVALRPTQVLSPGFENRFVPRLGVEYRLAFGASRRERAPDAAEQPLLEVPLRAGYVYEASPVPPQTGITNFVDADRHVLSIGTGAALHAAQPELPATLRLDVHGQLSLLPERTIDKTNPADFVGSYRAGGTMLGLGATLSAVF
jgi:long-chain fatty acid transport protein